MNNFWRWFTQSRKRIFFVTLLTLLVLDAGRSLYARVGYATPAEPWQDAPYQAIAWPPGSGELPAASTRGQVIFMERCATCHGPEGRGNGPGAPSMTPRPTDFRLGLFKYKSTPDGQPPTDADLIEMITNGLNASAMPYWGDILTDEEIRDVAAYVKTLSPGFAGDVTPEMIAIPERVTPDAASLARGAEAFASAGCTGCHGQDGRSRMKLTDQRGYPVNSRDLTAPWTFRGRSEPDRIYLRLTTGLAPGPMPSYEKTLSPEARWDVVNYVLSLARTAPWESGGTLDGPGFAEEPVKRGEYLVHAEMCGLCHTQVNAGMIYSGDDYYLAGGMAVPAGPQGTFVSPNLTGDPETGLGNWSEEEIANAIRNGQGKERNLNFFGMPWAWLHSFEQEDALAIASYLKSLPPVTNKIPRPLKYGFVETVAAKIAASRLPIPLGDPTELVYKSGNYGQTDPGLLPRDWPQVVLIWGQWIVLGVGVFAWLADPQMGVRSKKGFWAWFKFVFSLLGIAILGFIVWVMYSTPVLPFIPPEIINQGVTAAIPPAAEASFETPEQAALAARGEYLYKVTSCTFCHGPDGSGGPKINHVSFGTVWVRNISSDAATGIGAWTDAEVARAIRSGVSRDGGPLHWQGMVWDHLSNLDEEDVRALIVYLRILPPVSKEIPAPVPPGPGDCEEYTFYLAVSWTPGCGVK